MKVALCLSGLSRCLELSYIFHKHYILDKFKNVDIYIHTWNINNDGHRLILENQLPIDPCHTKSVEEYIKEDIKPVEYFIDDYKIFSDKYGTDSTPAMYYSINQSNEMKIRNEVRNNFKYDLVIRSRMDSIFCKSISVDEISNCNKTIYVACNRDRENLPQNHYNVYTDMFAFSNSELMDIYSKSFDTWLSNKSLKSESVVTNHLKSNNINVEYSKIKFMSVEQYTVDRWTFGYYNK